tara:strand:+ start:1414 stop:2067 length:654 start_codon:yes stop_codon:yes gene_type:complete
MEDKMKQYDNLDPSGHLEIYKVYADGTEEQVFDDHNVITSGMGVGLGLLYAGSGAVTVTNFQIRYFQLGVSGNTIIDSYGVSETALVSALGQDPGGAAGAYALTHYNPGGDSTLPLVVHDLMEYNGTSKAATNGGDNWVFAVISENSIKRVDLNSVTYILYVDRNTCNGQIVNEVGLFMENPLGVGTKRSNLVAYRPFVNINKTDDFALVFKWTLNF